jgi:hypothetical protein
MILKHFVKIGSCMEANIILSLVDVDAVVPFNDALILYWNRERTVDELDNVMGC